MKFGNPQLRISMEVDYEQVVKYQWKSREGLCLNLREKNENSKGGVNEKQKWDVSENPMEVMVKSSQLKKNQISKIGRGVGEQFHSVNAQCVNEKKNRVFIKKHGVNKKQGERNRALIGVYCFHLTMAYYQHLELQCLWSTLPQLTNGNRWIKQSLGKG